MMQRLPSPGDKADLSALPQPGERWIHYKGGRYEIVGIGHDSRDGNAVVVYRTLVPDSALRVRPLGEFRSYADHGAPRFLRLPEHQAG
jgi:hypothetical protein